MTRKRQASPLPTASLLKLPKRISSPRPAPAPPPRSEPASLIGAQIKALRVAARTSGGELAARAGVSRAMLSRVERGLASPSVRTLDRIADALGVSISRFFAETARRTGFLHVQAGRGIPVDRQAATPGSRCELLGHLLSGDLHVAPCMVQVDAHHQTPGMVQHPGLKFVYILAGRARYRYGLKEVSVGQGDALLFDAAVPHGVVATQEVPVRYLCAAFSMRE